MALTEEHLKLGKVAYEAYCASTGGRSLITGDKLPGFDGLKPTIRTAWAESAKAVQEACR